MMQSTHSNTSQTSTKPNMNNPDEKITSDLSTLSEQISLCQSMLVNAGPLSSIQDNEALLTVIGFLEACVPRMMELIEAAASGAIKEETFEMCLTVNDKLTNILADVEKDPEDRQPLTEAASAASGSSGDGDMVSDNKIDSDMNKLSITSEGADSTIKLGGKTSGMSEEDLRKPPPEEIDPFAGGPDLLQPTQTAPLTMMGTSTTTDSAMAPSSSSDGQAKTDDNDDDFDAFFKDRTTAS